jgi:hypothetical protein
LGGRAPRQMRHRFGHPAHRRHYSPIGHLVILASGPRPGPRETDDDTVAALDAFVSHRLITADQHGIAITYEVLIAAWPRLRGWLDGDRADWPHRPRVRGVTDVPSASCGATRWIR